MRQLIGKLNRDRRGFSMVELLVVLLILLLVMSVVAGGLPMARKAHRDVVDGANAQLLLSTVMTRLRDELGTAGQVSVQNKTVSYIGFSGRRAMIYPSGDDLWLEYPDVSGSNSRPLIGEGTPADRLSVSYDLIEFSDGVLTFYGLSVQRDGEELAGVPQFCIRVVTESRSF